MVRPMGRRLADLRLATKLAWFVGLGAVTFAVFAAASLQTLRTVVVNGPIYQELVWSEDVVADVLPPPAYLVEVYAAALQLLGTQEELASAAQFLAARADRLRGLVERFRATTEPATPWRGSTGPGPDAPAAVAGSKARDGGQGRTAEAPVGRVGLGGEDHRAPDLVGDGASARGRQA
jgi:hypothetical protein